jgi:hypothetical protein
MNEELAKHAKNNDFDSFESAYTAINPKGNAKVAFNAIRSELSGGGGGNKRYSETIKSYASGDNLSSYLADKSGVIGKLAGAASDLSRFVAKGVKGAIASQYGEDEKTDSAGKLMGVLGEGGLNPLKLIQSSAQVVLDELNQQLKNESELLTDVNSKVGISGKLSEGIRKDMLQASIEGERYQISLKEIGEFYTTISKESGKFALINRNIMESALPVSKVLGMTMSEMGELVSKFEVVGSGSDKTIKALGDAATRTVSLGLNARTVSKQMTENIGKLNEYGFQNGIKGLERMAQKAVEFRMEMSSVTAIADKVFSPEGAIELSANLQVLGGAMGDFNDPIKLMYSATNNVEGLQDALIGAAKGLATYNQEQGRFEITGANLRKAKEMANSLGISMGELTKTAIAGAERMSASTALMANSISSGMDDKDKEFLINMSRMEGGEMKIVIPESLSKEFGGVQEIALDKITGEQAKALTDYQKEFEKMNVKDLAVSQLTATQQMVRSLDVMARYAIVEASQSLKGGANAVLKSSMEKFKSTVDEYNNSNKTIYDKEKNAENTVNGVINDIKAVPSKIVEGSKELWNKMTGNEPTTQPTTQTIKMEHTFKSEGTITDSVLNSIRKDPTSMEQFGIMEKSSKDFTQSNPAIKK